jgi:hypothetical protein
MKYIIRLNTRAFNPITRKVIAERVWEVEQTATKDSEKCVWHGHEVRINQTPIRELYRLPKEGEQAWEMVCWGICVRGLDDAIEIKTGLHDASGN